MPASEGFIKEAVKNLVSICSKSKPERVRFGAKK